jgi:acetolactate synthase-1/2/3 large subunit
LLWAIAEIREASLTQWNPKLTSDEVPLSPYRVVSDLLHTIDVANTITTHDAGSPRDQFSPFWVTREPLTYLGWRKTTKLGYGLGLAMGAKLACPDKLCINVWGDAASPAWTSTMPRWHAPLAAMASASLSRRRL